MAPTLAFSPSPSFCRYLAESLTLPLPLPLTRYLAESVYKKPVIVYNYPKGCKAFYMRANDGCAPGKETVAAMDVLFPKVGEMVGGSQREERPDVLDTLLESHLRAHTRTRRHSHPAAVVHVRGMAWTNRDQLRLPTTFPTTLPLLRTLPLPVLVLPLEG